MDIGDLKRTVARSEKGGKNFTWGHTELLHSLKHLLFRKTSNEEFRMTLNF